MFIILGENNALVLRLEKPQTKRGVPIHWTDIFTQAAVESYWLRAFSICNLLLYAEYEQ